MLVFIPSVAIIRNNHVLTSTYMFIYNLDGEEADLILVGGTESTQVPVEDDRAAIETDTNFT